MRKSIKKIVFIFTTCLLAITLAACTAAKPLTSQEVINKYAEVVKNIKNTTMSSQTALTLKKASSESQASMNIKALIQKEPLAALYDMNLLINNNSQNVSIYIKDNEVYGKNGNKSWGKSKQMTEELQQKVKTVDNLTSNNEILDFYKNNANDFTVENKDNEYVLSYSGNDQKFKTILKSEINSITSSLNIEKTKLDNADIKITIRKSDFYITSANFSFDFSQESNSQNKATLSTKYEFTNINSTVIKDPEDLHRLS